MGRRRDNRRNPRRRHDLGALGTPAGALDGWVARYDAAGSRAWLQQFGTAANEEVWGLTADAAGNTYVAAYSAGDFAGPLAGDKDLVAARFDPAGTLTWKDQLGTELNDKGAAVGLDGAGNLYVAGFSDGELGTALGKFDAVLVEYAPTRRGSGCASSARPRTTVPTSSPRRTSISRRAAARSTSPG